MTAAPRTDLEAVARERADAALLRVVRCPSCLGALAPLPSGEATRGVLCAACGRRFLEDADGILDLVLASNPDPSTAAPRTESVRARYDREALLYDLAFRVLARAIFRGSLERMRELGQRAGATPTALDLPAGTGLFLPSPADATDVVVACDYSRSMLVRAKERAARDPVRLARTRFVRADVHRLPFESGSFTGVSCLNGLHVFPDYRKAASELARVRAKGGLAVGCSVTLPAFGPRRLAARALVWRQYMTTLFDERELRAVLVESGLARSEDVFREGDEIYWASRA